MDKYDVWAYNNNNEAYIIVAGAASKASAVQRAYVEAREFMGRIVFVFKGNKIILAFNHFPA